MSIIHHHHINSAPRASLPKNKDGLAEKFKPEFDRPDKRTENDSKPMYFNPNDYLNILPTHSNMAHYALNEYNALPEDSKTVQMFELIAKRHGTTTLEMIEHQKVCRH